MLGIDVGECCAQIETELVQLNIDFNIECTTDYLRMDSPGVGQVQQGAPLFLPLLLGSSGHGGGGVRARVLCILPHTL